jgi:hypothetical protein
MSREALPYSEIPALLAFGNLAIAYILNAAQLLFSPLLHHSKLSGSAKADQPPDRKSWTAYTRGCPYSKSLHAKRVR